MILYLLVIGLNRFSWELIVHSDLRKKNRERDTWSSTGSTDIILFSHRKEKIEKGTLFIIILTRWPMNILASKCNYIYIYHMKYEKMRYSKDVFIYWWINIIYWHIIQTQIYSFNIVLFPISNLLTLGFIFLFLLYIIEKMEVNARVLKYICM